MKIFRQNFESSCNKKLVSAGFLPVFKLPTGPIRDSKNQLIFVPK